MHPTDAELGLMVVLGLLFAIVVCSVILCLGNVWTMPSRGVREEPEHKRKPCAFCNPNKSDESEQKEQQQPLPKTEQQPMSDRSPDNTAEFVILGSIMAMYFGFIFFFEDDMQRAFDENGFAGLINRFGGWRVLYALIGTAVIDLYLRCAPAVILKLRQKPDGWKYQNIVDSIVKEDIRRNAAPPMTRLYYNNGFSVGSQFVIMFCASLLSTFSPFIVVIPVAVDYFSGKRCLKTLIRYYVKHYHSSERTIHPKPIMEQLKELSNANKKPAKHDDTAVGIEFTSQDAKTKSAIEQQKEISKYEETVREITHAENCFCPECNDI